MIIGSRDADLCGEFYPYTIGQFSVKFATDTSDWTDFPQFGMNGDLTPLMPSGFVSVKAIIENYEQVLKTVQQWPDSKDDAIRIHGRGGNYLVWKEIDEEDHQQMFQRR